jgi:hypothetical protein
MMTLHEDLHTRTFVNNIQREKCFVRIVEEKFEHSQIFRQKLCYKYIFKPSWPKVNHGLKNIIMAKMKAEER